MFDEAFLSRQQAYYNARAAEYDEWWERRGRYRHGEEEDAVWFREQAEVYQALEGLQLRGNVLELACGTGTWTLPLSRTAEHVTAMDGSSEMLAINRRRVASDRVEYRQVDLFEWEPRECYDGVVFGFWLSHVPPGRVVEFLRKVRRALTPKGGFFFVDSRRDPVTTSHDQPLPEEEQTWLTRRLNDGSEYRIVKVFYVPEQVQELARAAGLWVDARETDRFFIYGRGGVLRD